MPTPFLKIFPPLLVAFFLTLPPFHAAPKEDSVPPPSPSVGELIGSPRVVRGGVCEVIVRGIAMPRESVEFKIYKGPRYGSLEGPRPRDKDSFVYIYRHNGKKGADSDRIDFKLKTGPNNTWGRLTATIAIEELASRVELVSNQLDFGPVPIGKARSALLQVRNGGGGILNGTIETGEPWSIEGPAEFQLAEGQSRDFQVVFTPDGPSERQGRLDVIEGTKKHSVILRGEGAYRFDASERIAFQSDSIGKSLEIPLTNLTNSELPLSLVIPPPLIGESQTTLPANGTVALKLQVEKRHYPEKFAEVYIADGLAVRKVSVALPLPPALLEWASEGQVVDLGEMAPRNIPRPEFELRNRGATAATVQLREGGGGLALAKDQPEEFHLRPGESAVVKTVWRLSENPGEVTASLVASHGGVDHTLGVRAIIQAPEAAPEEATASASPNSAAIPTTPFPKISRLSEDELERLRRESPADIRYVALPGWFTTDLRLLWAYSGPQPVDFVVEIFGRGRPADLHRNTFDTRLTIPGELPSAPPADWVPVAASAIQRQGDHFEAVIRNLPPGHHTIRLGTQFPGRAEVPYQEFPVFVPAPPSIWSRWEISAVIALLSIAFLLRGRILSLIGRPSE